MDLQSIVDFVVSGQASQWFIKNVVFNTALMVNNNFLELWAAYKIWAKIASMTKTKVDDRAANFFGRFLLRFKSGDKPTDELVEIPKEEL